MKKNKGGLKKILIYYNNWITDFRKRLSEYQKNREEPQLNLKSYFIDSGLFFLELIKLYPENEYIRTIWDWLYHLGSLFAWNVSKDYFGRFFSIQNSQDLNNCNNTIQQMYLAFHAMLEFKIPIQFSIFRRFFERLPNYYPILKRNLRNSNNRALSLYGACISLQTFDYLMRKFDPEEKYYQIAQNCYNLASEIIIEYFEKYNIFYDLQNNYGLWSFLFKVIKQDLRLSSLNLIDPMELKQKLLGYINKIDNFKSIPYVLDNFRGINSDIFKIYLNKLEELLENFTYTGSYWSLLARFAKSEFYLKVFRNTEEEEKYLKNFLPFKKDSIPDRNINVFLENFLKIIDLIEEDSSLKAHIREETLKESHFRDLFKNNFRSKEWIVDQELEGRLDYPSDLRVGIPNTLFRITIEFKIWKRNFDTHPPIQQLLNNMGVNDSEALMFMINPRNNPIIESYKDELIYNHPKFYPGSYEEKKIIDRHISIFKAGYKENDRFIWIFHYILNLSQYIRN
ncbi:MAG: hypothetical protein GF329_20775 [Candidatus Lokiarchaeota archaeon]|nr:hypothetical protein [Candidatus Lokiarchaeota archaeon]